MNDELDKLEREVEAALASLSADLTLEPAETLVHQVKEAVRHELNAAWLTQQPSPLPSAEALQRVRAAVHRELQEPELQLAVEAKADHGPPARRFAWSPAGPLLAAAAIIAICVGVIHYLGSLKPPALPDDPATEAKVDLFVEVAEQVFAPNPLTASIIADLDVLEENIARGEPVWECEMGVLDEIVSEIDELLSEPDPGENMSKIQTRLRGAFG